MTFEDHLNSVLAKVNKTIGFLRKLWNLLSRATLTTIYKAFFWPYLDYGYVLYNQALQNSFKEKLQTAQYNACLALTRAVMNHFSK